MYERFDLVLVVNHACNLRCAYCYTGEKSQKPMPPEIGLKAIDRAVASISPGGVLQLGFFGGEPLLEADLICRLIDHARSSARKHKIDCSVAITTNGMITTGRAWQVMLDPDVDLSVSHDGLPEIHDRHRRTAGGAQTSAAVLRTIERLLTQKRRLQVVMVVRPDSIDSLASGIERLWNLGVREFEPSLDVWATWTPCDLKRLIHGIEAAAEVWRRHLPHINVGWFDEKAAALGGMALSPSARCGFGSGEVAVAPSGNLYPCERIVGADEAGHPLRLPGHCLMGDNFLPGLPIAAREKDACRQCAMQSVCNTTCPCSNYIRTRDIRRPDRLLCEWNQACVDAVTRVLEASPLGLP